MRETHIHTLMCSAVTPEAAVMDIEEAVKQATDKDERVISCALSFIPRNDL